MKCLLIALMLVVFLAPVVSYGASGGFGYYYVGTSVWVPGSSDHVLDILDVYGHYADLVTVKSASDMRLFMGTRGYGVTAAGAESGLATFLNVAHVAPAAGKTYYGQFGWLLSPARTDTVYVDVYRRVQQ